MEIKSKKRAWQELFKAQEVFKPISNFRFKVNITSEGRIEICAPQDFKMWQKSSTCPKVFNGKNIIEATNNFLNFFKKGNVLYIKQDSDRIEFLAILYIKNNKWHLKKEVFAFNFFKKDGSLKNNLRPFPWERI
ncbi:MAG: hypothetical protein PF488_00090 [Patescibacteria group bacterium]|jgi:hypothetical protein|nr:hypothetical protein [Patescibacteria group bacterium]